MTLLEDLGWRGLVHQQTSLSLEKHLEAPRSVYCGFDPTAPSLTVGNLVPLLVLRHFQRAGHQPVVVLGGATGSIGDPSGKNSERNLLDLKTVNANVEAIRPLISQILNAGPPPIIVNNLNWLQHVSWLHALRVVGKHFSVNAMLQKDSVRSRMNRDEEGISYTEFSYMLLQAFDFFHLWSGKGVSVQVAGSDQWSNICAGIDLIHRQFTGAEVFGMTSPLLTKSDGSKFGKSESGAVWLSSEMTSVQEFYQFWLNVSDEDVEKYLKALTFVPAQEIVEVCHEHAKNPAKRIAQNLLAQSVTTLVHGESALELAEASRRLFSVNIKDLDAKALEEALSGVPSFALGSRRIGISAVDLLAEAGIASSKREARTLLKSGAITASGCSVDVETKFTTDWVMHGSFLPIRKGKKSWYVVRIHQE